MGTAGRGKYPTRETAMKKDDVKVGGTYSMKVGAEVVSVRITDEKWRGDALDGWVGVMTLGTVLHVLAPWITGLLSPKNNRPFQCEPVTFRATADRDRYDSPSYSKAPSRMVTAIWRPL